MSVAARPLKAPFQYFGGKSRAARLVWDRFGDCPNYVEPFAGSLSVLLARPTPPHIETVNDADGLLCNFWRSVQAAADEVAQHADWPVNELDLHARHAWLIARKPELTERLRSDPEYYDAQAAGWWVWGISQWIGHGWCAGISRQLPHLGDAGCGIHARSAHIHEWFAALSDRLRNVRVCCGDWTRIMGPSVIGIKPRGHGRLPCGIFLDPPYSHADRDSELYAVETDCSGAVREWAIAHGDDPDLRIALCGYEGEHVMPSTWECVPWKARGGYGSQKRDGSNTNAGRERIWFNKSCIQPGLF